MLLGISSMNGLNTIDTDSGIIEQKYDSNCYGFTFCDDYYFLKTSIPGKHPRSALKILVMDKQFNIVDKIDKKQNKIVRGHQMQYHIPSNKLWLTSPGEQPYCNDIYIYDLGNEECEIWTPIRNKARLHYNSLCFNGDLLYILAHNYHRIPSHIFVYNWMTRKFLDKKKLKYGDCHNVFCIGNDLCYCASPSSKIMNINGDVVIDTRPDGGDFIRGIAFNDQYLFVGNSLLSRPGPKRLQSETFLMYDINTQKFIKSFDLPKSGAIHEIRILDGIDYAHTTGESCD